MNSKLIVEGAVMRYRSDMNNSVQRRYDPNEINNKLFELSCKQEGNRISIDAMLKQELIVELFLVQFSIKKQGDVTYLNKQYQIQPLNGEVWNNDLTPLYIQYQYDEQHYLLSNTQGMFSYSVKDKGEHLRFSIYLDAAVMHPAWSHRETERKPYAVKLLPARHRYKLSFSVNEIDAKAPPPVLSRYPSGAEACFIITDHCDYDQADTLHAFLHGSNGNGGWLGKGLKMTKGVFTFRSDYKKEGLAATLQDSDYKKLIAELHNDGSEIAPHALNQSGQISKEIFDVAFTAISGEYDCNTWIDHGSYQKYTYSVGGGDNEYRLTDRLKEYGYSSLWSYHDAPIDGTQSLNIFSDVRSSLKRVRKNLLLGKWSTAGHYLKTVLEHKSQTSGGRYTIVKLMGAVRKNILRKKSINGLIKDVRSALKYSASQQLPYTAEELKQFAPVLYTESRQPLHQQKSDDLLLFASQEVVHTQDAYTSEAVKQLIEEKGLHIGHTYLLNTLTYLNGVFDSKKELTKEWKAFVEALSAVVKNGSTWNPTMHEFVTYTKQLSSLHLSHQTSRSIFIENKSNENIAGVSFISSVHRLPNISWGGLAPIHRKTGKADEIIFWGDIPANTTITITW